MSREIKKKIVLISVLLAVLIGLVLVYTLVVLPLMEEEEPPAKVPPAIAPGEGLYLNTMITIYPALDKQSVEYIEINNEHGTYAFHKYYDSQYMDSEEMRLVGHERIPNENGMYSMLTTNIFLPVAYQSNVEENAPLRNLTDEEMKVYGVTEDTCQASYTVRFKDELGQSKSYTVYVGHATLTSETTYYAALKGRNSVYRLHKEGIEDCLLAPVEEYIVPRVYEKFENVDKALDGVVKFEVGKYVPNKGSDLLFQILKNQKLDGTVNSYKLVYPSVITGKAEEVGASAEKVRSAFSMLYVKFAGDKTVCLSPTAEDIREYGLAPDDYAYHVKAYFSEDEKDYFEFRISEEIDGYFYTFSSFYGDKSSMIVRVPKSGLSFLNSEGKAVFDWAGTDISALFYQYLLRNEEPYAPGMSEIIVRVQKKNDKTGEIIYNIKEGFSIVPNGTGGVVATQQSNGTQYVGRPTDGGGWENEFVDFYRMLIYFPNPTGLNGMTDEERAAVKADPKSLIFEFVARDNDNNLFKYTYYQIDNSLNIMVEVTEGKLVGGEEVWGKSQVNFNTSLSQIDILRESYHKLVNGEDVRPEDYIY